MKIIANKRLFWFLKEGIKLDLSNKSHLDLYIQQSLSRGKASDIKRLFKVVGQSDFISSLNRIKNFLLIEVKRFWEEWLADINRSPKKDT